MSNSFKRDQLVKFLPNVKFSEGTQDYDWSSEFRETSDISRPFVVASVMLHGGRQLIQLKPSRPEQRCTVNWWVPSAAFAPHTPDWLEDLPLVALEA